MRCGAVRWGAVRCDAVCGSVEPHQPAPHRENITRREKSYLEYRCSHIELPLAIIVIGVCVVGK